MAHMIDTTTGQAAVFVSGQPAWHRLGKVVKEAQTSEEAIKLAEMDWEVERWPIEAHTMREVNGELKKVTVECPGKVALIRSDKDIQLSVLSTAYVPFQNREAFQFFDDIVADKLAMYETAGCLKGGRVVWILARLPQELRAKGNDVTHPYVLLTNSHDGSSSLKMIPTSIRVVCWNTLSLALRDARKDQGISIMHRGDLSAKVDQAREALGLLTERFGNYQTEMQAMAETQVSGGKLEEYIHGLAKEYRKTEESQNRFRAQIKKNLRHASNTVEGIEGSVWAAYNAVSFYADHQMTVRGQGMTKVDNRLNSIWFGQSNNVKQEAFSRALQLVG